MLNGNVIMTTSKLEKGVDEADDIKTLAAIRSLRYSRSRFHMGGGCSKISCINPSRQGPLNQRLVVAI